MTYIAAGQVPDIIRNKRVITLDVSALVAGSKYRGEFEDRLKKVVKEVIKAGDVIDVWLTDFKYGSTRLAGRLSKARDYPDVAAGAKKFLKKGAGGRKI